MTCMKYWKLTVVALILVTVVIICHQILKHDDESVQHKINSNYVIAVHTPQKNVPRRFNFRDAIRSKNQTECNYRRHMKTKNPQNDAPVVINGESYIIYSCRSYCGGLADQFQGIMSAFMIAKNTGRLFRIEKNKQCDITSFLVPSPQYDWTDVDYIGNLSSCFVNTTVHVGTKRVSSKANDFLRYLNESIVYLQSNRLTRVWKPNFKNIYKELFKYDTSIENEITHLRTYYVKSNKTVCAHLRVGKNKEFQDTDYNNLGNISAIWTFLSTFDKPGYVIYVASDSEDVRESARRRFRHRYIEHAGRVINTAYQTDDDSCSGYRKLILDFAFLSECDILLLTNSNFGKYVSQLRDIRKNQYCFKFGKVYPCPVYNVRGVIRTSWENDSLVID